MGEAGLIALGGLIVGVLNFVVARWARPKVKAEAVNEAVDAIAKVLREVRVELDNEKRKRQTLP